MNTTNDTIGGQAKRRFKGGILAFIGFLLSPLTPWADLWTNVPLAFGFAWLLSVFDKRLFAPGFFVGYVLTNVAGLILMQIFGPGVVTSKPTTHYTLPRLVRDLGISVGYSALVVLLMKLGVISSVAGILN